MIGEYDILDGWIYFGLGLAVGFLLAAAIFLVMGAFGN
jgi:hypothetical protein